MPNRKLERLAYGMLGSVADAEDVVQDAELTLLRQTTAPDNRDAFLYRVVTNLCIDRLRALKRTRRHYSGPWLPEPFVCEPGEAAVERRQALSVGFLLMLERLSPMERIAFVLHEAFDYSHGEIADLTGASIPACRQRLRRARQRLEGEARFATPAEEQQSLLEALLAAVNSGDANELVQLLADDAVAISDGGGVVAAAIVPVTHPERIAQVSLHIWQRARSEGAMEYEWLPLNDGVGVFVKQNGKPHSCIQLEGREGQVDRVFIVRNPIKLARLASTQG